MKVLIIGAGDALAGAAITALRTAGHDVTVGVGDDRAHARARALGARPMRTPTARQLSLAAARCDVVCNLAPLLAPPRGTMAKLSHAKSARYYRRELDQLDQALVQAAVPRLIQRSSVSLYPDGGEHWIDETCPTAAHPSSWLCERAEQIAAAHDVRHESVVLRFAHPWGSDDPATRGWLLAARNGYDVLDLPASAYWPTIHLTDAAFAICAALSAPPGTYNVAEADPQPFAAVAHTVRQAVARHHLRPLPPSMSPADTSLYLRSHRIDSAALRTVARWHPTRSLTTHLDSVARRLQPYRLHQGWRTDIPW